MQKNVTWKDCSQSWWWDEDVITVKSQVEQEVIKVVLKPTTTSVYKLVLQTFYAVNEEHKSPPENNSFHPS